MIANISIFTPNLRQRQNRTARGMDPARWVQPTARSVLDVGCNAGELLGDLRGKFPAVRLAGCDVNRVATEKARLSVPDADIRDAGVIDLPFRDESFACVTCIETLEHIPPEDWRAALAEIRRVLVPGGRLVLRTPHAGLFGWVDSNNVRFRLPGLYRSLIGRGRRDAGYPNGSAGITWHHHFTRAELLDLAGPGWEPEATWYGGLILFPVADYLLWPFYRSGWHGGLLRKGLAWIATADYAVNYGRASYGILLALRKRA